MRELKESLRVTDVREMNRIERVRETEFRKKKEVFQKPNHSVRGYQI